MSERRIKHAWVLVNAAGPHVPRADRYNARDREPHLQLEFLVPYGTTSWLDLKGACNREARIVIDKVTLLGARIWGVDLADELRLCPDVLSQIEQWYRDELSHKARLHRQFVIECLEHYEAMECEYAEGWHG